jgi:Protein of unknown function (DUF1592)/Protein of unknown function (DUF1588)/Protein of unknown function (DUF1595)/Protein of unknown function (DUF1585)/Protein of unknown function (DUF1587)
MRASLIRSRLLWAALACGAAACNGAIGGLGGAGPGPGTAGGGTAGGGAGSGAGGSTGGGGSAGSGGAIVPTDPASLALHRLNSNEYNATVADVLGTTLQPANSSWLGGEFGGFDNMAAYLDVDEPQYQRYFDAAGQIADDVFASPAQKAKIVTCATTDAACVDGIIGATGRRLFRRPLDAAELVTYKKVYTAAHDLGEDHDGSVKQVLRAFLSSSEFLYRVEFDPTPTSAAKHPLTSYELASRLSYFLWSSAPDDALLTAAADGSLAQDDKVRAQVARMLADPVKSQRFVENFAGQWLGARKLPQHGVDATAFPDWTPQMAASLTKEMYLYFGEFLSTDRPWSDFMKADLNFVDASTAKVYGVAAPTQAGLQRTTITTDKRVGFAGLGGFLALSSLPKRTSPTLRGRWILNNLLCQTVPDPPKDVPDIAVTGLDPTKNIRAALEEHRKVASCAACHSSFDPFGLSLEEFDGIGKFRTTYSDGTAIDASATLKGVTFTGLQGMADTVTANPKFNECVAQFMLTYGLGRQLVAVDKPALQTIQTQWAAGTPTLRRLVETLALSEPFRTRQGAAN